MNDRTLLRLISGFFSFLVALGLTVVLVSSWLKFTIFDTQRFESYIGAEFYDELYSEVCENIEENTASSDIPPEVVLAPLTPEIIKNEINAAARSLFNGESYSLVSTGLSGEYETVIRNYAEQNGRMLDEEALTALIRYLTGLIETSVKIPLSNSLSPYIVMCGEYLVYVMAGGLAFAILAAAFLFFLCRPRIVFLSLAGRSIMCCGIIGTALSGIMLVGNYSGNLNLMSAAYASVIHDISGGAFGDLLVASLFVLFAGIILSVVSFALNTQAAPVCETENSEKKNDEEAQSDADDEGVNSQNDITHLNADNNF